MLESEKSALTQSTRQLQGEDCVGAGSEDVEDRRLARQLDVIIGRYARTVRRAIRRSGEHFQLTDRELRCLQLVAANGPILPSELARRAGVAVSTSTRTVDLLVDRGLVTRGTLPEYNNRVHVVVTPGGASVLARYESMADDHLARALARLTSEQKTRLEQAVADLASILAPQRDQTA